MKSYHYTILLISAIFAGGLCGLMFPHVTVYLKPIGDIFLNLLLTILVPLIFFNVSSAFAKIDSTGQLRKIIISTFSTFIFMSALAAIYMIAVVKCFPIHAHLSLTPTKPSTSPHALDQIASSLTVNDFSQLFSSHHLLALILFSLLVGIATANLGSQGAAFQRFLVAGERIFMKVMTMVMQLAPLGFFAYFAVLVHDLGPNIIHHYLQVIITYCVFASLYAVTTFSLLVYLFNKQFLKRFYRESILVSLTALATCSSAASIPVSLAATKQVGVSPIIAKVVIPLGMMLHKNGSVLGAIIKIAFLFSVFQLSFSGTEVFLYATLVAILVGTIMGAIPSGGMTGEVLLISLYHFPSDALMIIVAISILIDPLATIINVLGNNVAAIIVDRTTENIIDEKASDLLVQKIND